MAPLGIYFGLRLTPQWLTMYNLLCSLFSVGRNFLTLPVAEHPSRLLAQWMVKALTHPAMSKGWRVIIQHTRHLAADGKQKGTEHMAIQPALMIRKNDDGENVLAAGARDFFFSSFFSRKNQMWQWVERVELSGVGKWTEESEEVGIRKVALIVGGEKIYGPTFLFTTVRFNVVKNIEWK